MNRAKAIAKLFSIIVASAHALSVNGANAATGPVNRLPDAMTTESVMSSIERINRNNPAAAARIEIALAAGQSELIAAIVQSVRTCDGDVGQCVHAAIVRAGGLSKRNLISLTDLAAALQAVGVSQSMIASALDSFSSEVTAAVNAGVIPKEFAAATLAGGTSNSLYA